ncbi:MAG: hypothetical protein M1833_005729 [Piccolia ochrophora]|nr:MAG: hypothetical protein M1833_005729 [Piccolia ochrophora]
MASMVLHLRSETKYLERCSALSPLTTKSLLEAGYRINVERSPSRIFQDKEFEAVGATLVPAGSWRMISPFTTNTSNSAIATNGKTAGSDISFAQGGGTLYDIEFLADASGRRVAAFGYYAGYAGAAIALVAWSHQLTHPVGEPLRSIPISDYESESAVVKSVKSALSSSLPNNAGQPPRVLIIGALGRCGSGAADFCLAAGVPASSILKWDTSETASGGPFPEIAAADIFINCIYLAAPTPPFVTRDSLSKHDRRLRVACDVSCDPNNPHNPVPVYSDYSTFERPTLPVESSGKRGESGILVAVVAEFEDTT